MVEDHNPVAIIHFRLAERTREQAVSFMCPLCQKEIQIAWRWDEVTEPPIRFGPVSCPCSKASHDFRCDGFEINPTGEKPAIESKCAGVVQRLNCLI